MTSNFAKIKAIEKKNKERILRHCPNASDKSGIYILTREAGGFRYGYVGQSKHILTRLAEHLSGYEQHIDKSIKKHGLWSVDKITGYRISVMECTADKLDEYEQKYIRELADKGYQMRNKTSGGQGAGKTGIAPNKPAKGYYDGIKQGYKKAQEEVAKMFKYLTVHCDTEKKRAVNAMDKFNEFLTGGQSNG